MFAIITLVTHQEIDNVEGITVMVFLDGYYGLIMVVNMVCC